jgi:uncharacterized protein YecT (DUF1311 family)
MRKQNLLYATLIVAGCTILPTARAQESSCLKAPSSAEQYQCANNELATAQQDLESAYTDAIQHYTPKADDDANENAPPPPERNQQAAYERKMREGLTLSQKIWTQYQSSACAAVNDFYEGGTMGPTAAALCKAEIARQRAKFLRDNFGTDR